MSYNDLDDLDSSIESLPRYVVPSTDAAYGMADSLTYIFRNHFSSYTSGYKNIKFVMNWYSSATATSTGQCIVEGAILNGRATGITKARSGTDMYAFYVDTTEGGADAVIKKLSEPIIIDLWLVTTTNSDYSQFYISKSQFDTITLYSRESTVAYSLNDDDGPFISVAAGKTVTINSSDVNVALTMRCPTLGGKTHPKLTIYN